jgi:DNA topoisomerase-1
MAKSGLPREKVLATVVALLGQTYIRIGNEEYARQNGSYGLTTLASDHVAIEGSTVRFRFRGKSGKEHDLRLKDRRVAAVLRRCQSLPGQALFQYLDDDKVLRTIGSHDVNEYLRETTGTDFTAKDFRTWGGTVIAAQVLAAAEPPTSDTAANRTIAAAIKQVAARLGNTPAVCRKAYVHPAVLEAYADGQLARCWDAFRNWHEESEGLSRDERAVMRLLRTAERAAAQG